MPTGHSPPRRYVGMNRTAYIRGGYWYDASFQGALYVSLPTGLFFFSTYSSRIPRVFFFFTLIGTKTASCTYWRSLLRCIPLGFQLFSNSSFSVVSCLVLSLE